MQEKTISNKSYKLHMIKTNAFKTITFKVIFRNEIKKELITINNILIDYLTYSCNKYKSKKEMIIKKQDLYGAYIGGNNLRVGNYLDTSLSMSILNPKYTEQTMFKESLSFFKEIIFNPKMEDKSFDKETIRILKNNLKSLIISEKDKPNIYVRNRLYEEMTDLPISYKMNGYIEDIDKINENTLLDNYKKLINNSNIDIYVVGNIEYEEIEEAIKDIFNFETKEKKLKDVNINYKNTREEINIIKEETKLVQSKLAIACEIKDITPLEREIVATMYSVILGNSPEAKLFMNVREKQSLAYSISSSFKRSDGILTIVAGFSYKSYDKVIDAIKKEMQDMKDGKITEQELNACKELYISVLNEVDEYQSSIIDYYDSMFYYHAMSIEDTIKEIKKITKEDIQKLANKVEIDTIFVLKEADHENN